MEVLVDTFLPVSLVCMYILNPIFTLTPTLSTPATALASDNVNEDKPVSFVVKQLGSFNLKMHLGRGGGQRLKPSPSHGASQLARLMGASWTREGKVGATAGLDWFGDLSTFSSLVLRSDCLTLGSVWYRSRPIKTSCTQRKVSHWSRQFKAG